MVSARNPRRRLSCVGPGRRAGRPAGWRIAGRRNSRAGRFDRCRSSRIVGGVIGPPGVGCNGRSSGPAGRSGPGRRRSAPPRRDVHQRSAGLDDHDVGVDRTDAHTGPLRVAGRVGGQAAVSEDLDQGAGAGLIAEPATSRDPVVLVVDAARPAGPCSSFERSPGSGSAHGVAAFAALTRLDISLRSPVNSALVDHSTTWPPRPTRPSRSGVRRLVVRGSLARRPERSRAPHRPCRGDDVSKYDGLGAASAPLVTETDGPPAGGQPAIEHTPSGRRCACPMPP